MRNTLILLAVLLIAGLGFVYYRDPSGCQELVADLETVPSTGFGKFQADAGTVVTLLEAGSTPAGPSIASVIDGHLVSSDGRPFTFPPQAPASSLQYFAIYYSAQWCPPCHVFTPVLVEWYKKFKPAHPHFELIFVSNDHDKASWLVYMKEMAMPWPAFSFDDLQQSGNGIGKYAGSGIPDLVLVDATGKVLSDSFTPAGNYTGPQQVIADIEKLLGPATPPQANSVVIAPPPSKPVFAPPQPTWSPPTAIPAQPNWTWTTSDGTTYHNVVITKIGPATVSIMHATGVTHDIPVANLPPDIQKQLNYNPVAAAIARKESQREADHPYYPMSQRAEAQAVADQMHWPLAWLSAYADELVPNAPVSTDQAVLSSNALKYLQGKSIVILINPESEMPLTPPSVHHQFSKYDDGTLPGGANYLAPKIVFSTPDAGTILGRVSYTQMHTAGASAIEEVFNSFAQDSSPPSASTSELTGGGTTPTTPTSPTPAPPTAITAQPPSPDTTTAPALAPPAAIPAQPNWTWTTSDGTTYHNVVITKIEPDTVPITHASGVAHLPIYLLPPDIQKQLNYDPHLARRSPAP